MVPSNLDCVINELGDIIKSGLDCGVGDIGSLTEDDSQDGSVVTLPDDEFVMDVSSEQVSNLRCLNQLPKCYLLSSCWRRAGRTRPSPAGRWCWPSARRPSCRLPRSSPGSWRGTPPSCGTASVVSNNISRRLEFHK